jgi:methionyl aminopeptidase
MKIKQDQNYYGELITLKDQNWLDKQRLAGKIAADTLILLENLVKEKTTKTLIELNQIAENYIADQKAICTFKGYKNFPTGVCISVNQQLVHGIPTDYRLQEHDLVSFDLGVSVDKVIADTALTCVFGNYKSYQHQVLVQATETALNEAIETVKVGKRLGVIGEAIYQCGRDYDLSVITSYGGHGIDLDTPHALPFVSNRATEKDGPIIQEGLCVAIEPLFVLGRSTKTKTLADGWTVECEDYCSHHEHTIFVHADHIEIITARSN